MLYLIVDPRFLYLPHIERTTREDVEAFVGRLLEWSSVTQNYAVEFGMTRACQLALKEAARSAFDQESFHNLIEQYMPDYNTEDIVTVVYPFLVQLLEKSYIDELIEQVERAEEMMWDIDELQTLITPSDYLQRLQTTSLQISYQNMLAYVAFVRKNRVVSLSEFEMLRVLSVFEDWMQETNFEIVVRIFFDLVLDDSLQDREEIEREKDLIDTFQTVELPDHIEGVAPKVKRFATVREAADAAVQEHADVLIFPRLAQETADTCDHEDPNDIYRVLKGLVKVWLPAYLKGGDHLAGQRFYEKVQYEYAENESRTVRRNPHMRKDYEIDYNGELIFCGKHIKIGTGPRCVRVNFEVVKAEDSQRYHILLRRTGRHGANTFKR